MPLATTLVFVGHLHPRWAAALQFRALVAPLLITGMAGAAAVVLFGLALTLQALLYTLLLLPAIAGLIWAVARLAAGSPAERGNTPSPFRRLLTSANAVVEAVVALVFVVTASGSGLGVATGTAIAAAGYTYALFALTAGCVLGPARMAQRYTSRHASPPALLGDSQGRRSESSKSSWSPQDRLRPHRERSLARA